MLRCNLFFYYKKISEYLKILKILFDIKKGIIEILYKMLLMVIILVIKFRIYSVKNLMYIVNVYS